MDILVKLQGKVNLDLQLSWLSLLGHLCACHHIDVYLERTKAWRKNEGLPLNFINPHKFVTIQFLGLDCYYLELTLRFLKVQQKRSAYLSKSRFMGISYKEILKREHWTKESNFQKLCFPNTEKYISKFNNHIYNRALKRKVFWSMAFSFIWKPADIQY